MPLARVAINLFWGESHSSNDIRQVLSQGESNEATWEIEKVSRELTKRQA